MGISSVCSRPPLAGLAPIEDSTRLVLLGSGFIGSRRDQLPGLGIVVARLRVVGVVLVGWIGTVFDKMTYFTTAMASSLGTFAFLTNI